MILVVSKRLNPTPGPPMRQLGRQSCGRSNFWVELVKKGKSPSSLRWSNCRGPIWNSNLLCSRRCGPTWWRRSSTWRTATARFSTTAGSSFPLPILRYDDLMRVRLFKLNAPKYKLVLPQNFRLKMITPQVATFSVYAYFAAALFGRQFLEPRGEHKSVLWIFTF